jgi:hypothetical protein
MPISSNSAPTVGLILVILSMILLRLESFMFAATSFLMVLFGLILILLPDLKRAKLGSRQPFVRSGLLAPTSSTPAEATDRCALCGKPVPPDVAYCDECAKKRG